MWGRPMTFFFGLMLLCWGTTVVILSTTAAAASFAAYQPSCSDSRRSRPARGGLWIQVRSTSASQSEDQQRDSLLEQARWRLESQWADVSEGPLDPNKTYDPTHHHDDHQALILTSTARRLRQVEMKLLQSLLDSDQAVDELMHLWMTESCHGPATAELMAMEESCSAGLSQEQDQLQELIQQFPTWSEPRARLAMVYYYKGQLEKCRQVAEQVWQRKPWHFEMMHLLTLVALRQQDRVLALQWARLALPPLDRPRARRQWIQRALQQATEQLAQAEHSQRSRDGRSQQLSSPEGSGGIWE